jgi:ribose transport system permease protein
VGTLLGVLILAALNNGMVLLDISSFYQDIVRGGVILVAVFIDTHRPEYPLLQDSHPR